MNETGSLLLSGGIVIALIIVIECSKNLHYKYHDKSLTLEIIG